MSTYVVDSNFFIQAHRVIYPLDVAVSFWKSVAILAQEEIIVSIDKVKKELFRNDDDLKKWCINNLPNNFFRDSSELIKDHYLQKAIDEFLDADEADAWLVAYGLKYNCTVTTYEKSQPNQKRKIKIPEPCDSLGGSLYRHNRNV